MDKNDHYNKEVDHTKLIHLHRDVEEYKNDQTSNEQRSFSQRLGQANVMPTGMLDSVSNTDLAILSMLKEGQEVEK